MLLTSLSFYFRSWTSAWYNGQSIISFFARLLSVRFSNGHHDWDDHRFIKGRP